MKKRKSELEKLQPDMELINKFGSIITNTGEYVIQCITIIGQIEGHYTLSDDIKATKYEHILPQLVMAQESPDIDGVLILLNTVGGDVEAGLAIAEMIAGLSKPTVSMVLGGGHSIGVPLAVSAKVSFIAKSASMTIHPVRMTGLMLGVPQTFEYFRKIQERINNFICENSKVSQKRLQELLMNPVELATDVGTVLDGENAVREGFIDNLGSLSNALKKLHCMIKETSHN